jgi:hypothetical protein
VDTLSPAQVLTLRYSLESSLASPGSLSGPMLEAGMGGARPDGARRNTQEDLRARLADLTLFCRGLSPQMELACRLRYGKPGQPRPYRRLRRLCDIRDGDGEELLSLKPTGPDGEPMPGWAEVSGYRAELPSYNDIGAVMGLSPGQVRGILDRARSRIAREIRRRSVQSEPDTVLS